MRKANTTADTAATTAVAAALSVGEGTVSQHFGSILTELGLSVSDDTNRRVPAVLAYLRG